MCKGNFRKAFPHGFSLRTSFTLSELKSGAKLVLGAGDLQLITL